MTLSAEDMADLGAYFGSQVNTGWRRIRPLEGGRKALSRRRLVARHTGLHGLPRSIRRGQ